MKKFFKEMKRVFISLKMTILLLITIALVSTIGTRKKPGPSLHGSSMPSSFMRDIQGGWWGEEWAIFLSRGLSRLSSPIGE